MRHYPDLKAVQNRPAMARLFALYRQAEVQKVLAADIGGVAALHPETARRFLRQADASFGITGRQTRPGRAAMSVLRLWLLRAWCAAKPRRHNEFF